MGGSFRLSFTCEISAVGATTVGSESDCTLRLFFRCETSAVGATTSGVNCGTVSCETDRAEAATGCAAGTEVQATMFGMGTSWSSLTFGGVTIV